LHLVNILSFELEYLIGKKGGGKMTEEKSEEKKEKIIGRVTHYFNKIGVAVIELTEDDLKQGEVIHFKGGERDFEQKVESMQVEHKEIEEAKRGESIGLKVDEPVREGYIVYKVLE